jgi:tetratricopeptide (TPR) repeat protein
MKMAFAAVWLLGASLAVAESAQNLLAAGRADEAMAALNAQIASNANDAEAHNLLCRVYYSLGEWDNAIASCERAVALAPDQAAYHHWLGRAYGDKASHSNFLAALGPAKKLRNEFERAVTLDPGNVEARTDLAQFYVEAPGIIGGGTDKAQRQVEALQGLSPAKAHWILADIAEKSDDSATAEREYQAALEATHGSADGWLDLASFYKRRGKLDQMERAIKQASTAPVIRQEVLVDAAALLHRAQRNLPLAIDLVRRYLAGVLREEAPAFKAHTLLGNLLEKQSDTAGAEQQYRAALALAKEYKPAQEGLKRLGK